MRHIEVQITLTFLSKQQAIKKCRERIAVWDYYMIIPSFSTRTRASVLCRVLRDSFVIIILALSFECTGSSIFGIGLVTLSWKTGIYANRLRSGNRGPLSPSLWFVCECNPCSVPTLLGVVATLLGLNKRCGCEGRTRVSDSYRLDRYEWWHILFKQDCKLGRIPAQPISHFLCLSRLSSNLYLEIPFKVFNTFGWM